MALLSLLVKREFGKTSKKSQNIITRIVCIPFVFFMSVLTVPLVKSSHILDGIYCIFLRKCCRPNSKVYQYQIWTSKNQKGSYHGKQILAFF